MAGRGVRDFQRPPWRGGSVDPRAAQHPPEPGGDIVQRIILGMGAGHCGLGLLATILAAQKSARVSVAQPPLLPWEPRPNGPGIRERIARWRSAAAAIVGDVAAFYLPYAEEAVAAEPEVRMVCLKRPREEVIAGFRVHLDRAGPPRIDHWSRDPAPGWTHHPLLTQTYPQYGTTDREEGLALYWNEYYHRAEGLARRSPANFHVVDGEALSDPEGVRAVLDFVGIPRHEQVVATGPLPRPEPDAATMPRRHPLDPRRCVVLVPYGGPILPDCEEGLRELERRGYPVRRVGGYAAIDQGRNQMATDALVEGFEETLWIDSDIAFRPDDVERLRRHGLPIACGIYPQKGPRSLASHVLPGTPRLAFGEAGGLAEILYASAGFLLVRREVYLAVQGRFRLPVCNERFARPTVPYFQPMLRPIDDGHWYLAEDYAFCERARQCGFRVFADTTIRLWHVGSCRYGWEDAGSERQRHGSFTLSLDVPGPRPDRPG